MKTETRRLAMWGTDAAEIEVRDNPKGGKMIVGYAAVYNSRSQDLGGFVEVVAPGAFTEALKEGQDVRGRYNHSVIIGRSKAGTLRLFDETKGLRYEIDVPDTTAGRDLLVNIGRRDVDGSSFAFRLRGSDGDSWRSDNGLRVRTLNRCNLLDVGPVDYPAYLGTEGEVNIRSLPEASQRAAEKVEARGTPERDRAKVRLAENRFWLPSEKPADACADALRQACSCLDSLNSLTYKLGNLGEVSCQCGKAIIIAGACSQLMGMEAFDYEADGAMCEAASNSLSDVADACDGIDHPVARLAALVCREAAGQCDAMTAEENKTVPS